MQQVIRAVIMLGIMTGVTLIVDNVMKSKEFQRNRILNVALSLVVGILLLFKYSQITEIVTGMALFEILLYASWSDITTHEVDDYVWIMIALLLIPIVQERGPLITLTGGIVSALSFVINNLICKQHPIGGADIKMMFALGLAFGAQEGLMIQLFSLIFFIFVNKTMVCMMQMKKEAYPLIPFISIATVIMFLM